MSRKTFFRTLAGFVFISFSFALPSTSFAQEDKWTTKADMPTPRYWFSTSVVDGKIYAIGGWGGGSPQHRHYSAVEEYDPETDTWTKKADMPTARSYLSTSAVDGKIYAIGGWTRADTRSSVEEYDPATDTWTKKADMPIGRHYSATCAVDGKIYAIGGYGGKAIGLEEPTFIIVEEYDPATDRWVRKADMPTARGMLSACAVNGKIYAIGGLFYDSAFQGTTLSAVEEYDPATDTWTKKADMPMPTSGHAASVVNGKIYAIGGEGEAILSTVMKYDPATDIWTKEGDMRVPRTALSASAVDGRIYVIGGQEVGVMAISTVEEYDTGLNVPSPDFNGDGIVDSADMCMMVDHWHTDNALYDIAPPPFGDGIVDIQDLIVLAEDLFTYPGAVAYWRLDETEGGTAYDSAADYVGTLVGDPVWRPTGGMVAGAIQLDGADDYVSTEFVLDPADGAFSIFAWIKGGSPGQAIISQTDGLNWLCADASHGNLMTELRYISRAASEAPLVSQTPITDDVWHRVGLSWDGTNRSLYVDDVEVASDTQPSFVSLGGGLHIGTDKNREPGTFWSGLIDDVRIYNRAVTP